MGELTEAQRDKLPVFTCPLCKRRSYRPMDLKWRYCRACGFVCGQAEDAGQMTYPHGGAAELRETGG